MRAFSPIRRALLAAGTAMLTLPAGAIQDANGNGLSDVWERHYNGGNLFSPANPHHAPAADPDGDSWTNAEEAEAGTDPFDAEPPQGRVHAAILRHPDADGLFLLSWPTQSGKRYELNISPDLQDWVDFGESFPGTGEAIEIAFDAMHEDGTIPGKLFVRVRILDEDPDGDSLSSWEELKLGLDPHHPDSDRDGIFDNRDDQPLVSATLADPDGPLGLDPAHAASLAANVRGFWDFETEQGPPQDLKFPDRSGANRHASSFSGSASILGMPSKAGPIGPGCITIPPSTVQNVSAWTISGWFRLGKGEIQGSEGLYRTVFALYDRQGTGPSPQHAPLGQGTGLFVRKTEAGGVAQETWLVGGYKQTTLANGNATTQEDGHNFIRPAGSSDDGRWHHFAVTRSNTSNGQKVYIDGQLMKEGALKEYTVNYDADTFFTFGRLYPSHELGFTEALIDRVRVHAKLLSAAEIGALHQQDIDRDGLWDITEVNTRLWRDRLAPYAQRHPAEYSYPSSPFHWQFPDTDTDGDGLSDIFEQNHSGTDIAAADSDGDLMPDGWEWEHGLDPNDPSDAAGDEDGDGLSNLDEYRYGSNPRLADSDGDGKNDRQEADQGSHPADGRDNGQPPNGQENFSILLGIGDQSGSKSEDYVLNVFRIDPETGEEKRFYTLRSGGHGLYKEETRGFFRKGDTYTFQIAWQGTSGGTTPPGAPSPEGPDFDYTFKVQPQGSHGGLLIDSWNPKTGDIDPNRKLLHNDANNVAETAQEFRANFQDRRVLLYHIQTHSVDRMFAAAATILPGFERMELSITSPDTGRDFGTHGYLLGGGDTRVYTSARGMLGHEDRWGTLVQDPRVWFLRDPLSYNRVELYLVSGAPGESYGKIKIEAKVEGQSLGSVERTLQPQADFAQTIDLVTGWAAGRGFGFDTGGLEGGGAQPMGGGGPAPMGGPPADGAGLVDPQHWAAPILIPFMTIGHNIEGLTIIIRGLGEGAAAGLRDDLEFVKLVFAGVVLAGDFSVDALIAEVKRWRDAPEERLSELKALVFDFFEKQVFEPLGSIAADLTTLEGIKKRFWQAVAKGQDLASSIGAIGGNIWQSTVNGLESWFDDFGSRMTDGAERTAWLGTPFVKTGLLAEGTQLFREQCYTFGYTFGYLSEQVAIGALSGGTLKIAQVALKGGVSLAGNLARRTAASVAMRGHWLKKQLADSSLGDAAIREMYERGMVMCAVEPTGPTIKQCAFEVLEKAFARQGFDRATYNFKKLLDDITPDGNIRKLLATEGGEALIHRRAAQLAHLLGDECDEIVMKNFLKVADERLIVTRADGSVDEFFEGFFRAMEGNPSLLQHADVQELAIDSLSPNAKARLKQILSDPDPGNPWKFDDPVWVPNEDPPIPSNYWARGMLLEIDAYKRIYKPQGLTHYPTAAGYDYGGAKWVQVKSLSNPNAAVQRMITAINRLNTNAPTPESPLKLHILKKPGTDSSSLQSALESYRSSQGLIGRLEIIIEPYNLGPQ